MNEIESIDFPLCFNALEDEYLQSLNRKQLERLEALLAEFELE